MTKIFNRVPEITVNVLGVEFQAFIDPSTDRPVFSQRGSARALKIPARSLRRILASNEFMSRCGSTLPGEKLDTTVSSKPISVVTQSDLILIVQIAAEKGFPVAKSMQDASFAVLLQESVDRALCVERDRAEYLEAGAALRLKLEYIHGYRSMRTITLKQGHGVRGLCRINRQVSSLAVVDADTRRQRSKSWRRNCNTEETVKITIGNAIHEKAAEASTKLTLDSNLAIAAKRTGQIYNLLDAPFPS